MWCTTDYVLVEQVAELTAPPRDVFHRRIITAEETERWVASLARADQEGAFFACISGLLVARRKR